MGKRKLDPGIVVSEFYRLERHIGTGAHGSVWEVQHKVLGSLAMKIFNDPPGEDVVSLLREAQALSGINHPHIIRVYEVRILDLNEGPRAFLTTQLMREGSLEDLLGIEVRFSVKLAIDITAQLLSALATIHSLKPAVIHRDIIPSNIFIESLDPMSIKLGDFAIAQPVVAGLDLVPVGGVFRYFAPESAHGYMTPRTDLYAVGLLLYKMLTGSFAFPEPQVDPSQNLQAYLQQREQPPRPPSSLRRSLGPGVDGLVLRALAPRPQDRFPDAAAFRQACLAVLEMEG